MWLNDCWQVCQNYAIPKGQSFQQMYCENWIYICKRMKFDYNLVSYIKINSKWMRSKHMNQKYKTLGRKHRRKASDMDLVIISWICTGNKNLKLVN